MLPARIDRLRRLETAELAKTTDHSIQTTLSSKGDESATRGALVAGADEAYSRAPRGNAGWGGQNPMKVISGW